MIGSRNSARWVLAGAVLVVTAGVADGAPPAMEKVRISKDNKSFVLGESGKVFVPWGFNYVGSFNEIVEEYWATDWARVEKDFREMRALNANVVRIHLQFGTYMKGPGEVDAAELGRLRKMLDLARDVGLYLDLTGLNCFRLKAVPAWYDAMGEAERWEAQAKWWAAVARTCAGHPAVFCYDLMNEPVIGGAPKEGEPKWLSGNLGGFYFVQRLAIDPGKRSQKEIAEAWVSKLTAAIRKEDAETPITVGAIPWALVWPTAKPLFYSPEVGKHLDFVSVHFYPKTGEVAKAVTALGVYDVGKPLVVEETFPLSCSIEELNEFIDGTSDKADGWISHYFGRTIEEHRKGAEPGGEATARFLEYWRDKAAAAVSAREKLP